MLPDEARRTEPGRLRKEIRARVVELGLILLVGVRLGFGDRGGCVAAAALATHTASRLPDMIA